MSWRKSINLAALRERVCLALMECLLSLLPSGEITGRDTRIRITERLMRRSIDLGIPKANRASSRLARNYLIATLPEEAWSLVPSLEPRDKPVASTWTFQNEMMEWPVTQKQLVLDIGSGGWPFSKATHLADRYQDITTHRVEGLVRDDRPFLAVDIERMPFADKAYDFVFCSHVLEHLERPGDAIRELTRVGRRGYIEVPTRMSDILFNFTPIKNHHKWHGLVVGGTLILIEWGDDERVDCGSHFFEALHSSFSNQFQDFFERNRRFFFSGFQWRGGFPFLIIDKQGNVVDSGDSTNAS